MNDNTHSLSEAAVTVEGALLSEIHRLLVPLHASLAEGEPVSRDFQNLIERDLMAVLQLIEANREFQAARVAVRAQRKVSRSPRALAAEERVRQGREARRQAAVRT